MWHFPLLAVAGLLAPPAPGGAGLLLAQRGVVLALAFPLAALSWRWWERRWLVPAPSLRGAVVAEART